MFVTYTPKHNHQIVKDHVFIQHAGDLFTLGINTALADARKYGPSTSIWIVPGTYRD